MIAMLIAIIYLRLSSSSNLKIRPWIRMCNCRVPYTHASYPQMFFFAGSSAHAVLMGQKTSSGLVTSND